MGEWFDDMFHSASEWLEKFLNATLDELNKIIDFIGNIKVEYDACYCGEDCDCSSYDGMIFHLKDVPETHPNCHCGWSFVFEDRPITQVVYGGKMPNSSNPNDEIILINEKGKLEQKCWYDEQGRLKYDRDYTNHRRPNKHPKVPHDHKWDWSNTDNPRSGWKEVDNDY